MHEPLSDERYDNASCREWLRAECKSLAAEVRRLRALSTSRYEWKEIALYLADCHAASAEIIAHRKSALKSDRKRAEQLCTKAAEMIRASRSYGYARRSEETVLRRLDAISRTLPPNIEAT